MKISECGLVNRRSRIVGGIETEIHEFPWQVGIRYNWGSPVWCGGAIIAQQWILTAAHCIEG